MLERFLAPLIETLRPHFDLSKTRLETLAVLLVGLAKAGLSTLRVRQFNLRGCVEHRSNYRRLQCFFQDVERQCTQSRDLRLPSAAQRQAEALRLEHIRRGHPRPRTPRTRRARPYQGKSVANVCLRTIAYAETNVETPSTGERNLEMFRTTPSWTMPQTDKFE